MDDIGVVDHKNFSPMPIPLIAITLTVVRSLHSLGLDPRDILTVTILCFRSNGALSNGLVGCEEISTGTGRSSKPYMIRMSHRFATFRHIALRACINCSAIYCEMRGRISFSYCGHQS